MCSFEHWNSCKTVLYRLYNVYIQYFKWWNKLTELIICSWFEYSTISDSGFRVSLNWFPSHELRGWWTDVCRNQMLFCALSQLCVTILSGHSSRFIKSLTWQELFFILKEPPKWINLQLKFLLFETSFTHYWSSFS
jgi:hypothetical protein